jgi:hypothetical protein
MFLTFPGQPIWKFLGNRFVEAHTRGNAQATGTELVQIDISFAAIPQLLKFRSLIESHFELQRDSVKDFQLKEVSR